jgi:peroxiredoxin
MSLLLSRLVLAGVFAVAGFAKVEDRAGAQRSMVALGLPQVVVTPLASIVVAFELALALSLVFPATAMAAAMGALALLTGSSAVAIVSVARGRTPDCHCFGRLSSTPVGWSTVARNALLATMVSYVVAGGRVPLVFAILALASAGSWIVLVRSPGGGKGSEVRRGAPAPGFSLVDDSGQSWTLDALLARRVPVLLVFSHPGCGACAALLPELVRWQEELPDRLTIAMVSGGSPGTGDSHLRPLLLDRSGTVASDYGITATPSAVLIGRDGRIAAMPARGAPQITDLVDDAAKTADQSMFTRRWLLNRSGLALTALATLPVLAQACGSSTATAKRPRSLQIQGAYLCDQRYALCTDAACVPSKTDPSIVICACAIKTGYAVGFKSCDQRAPSGSTLHSNFSTQLVTSATRVMTCPASDQWANCLDVVCEIDPSDPSKANCQCQLVKTGPTVTFGGNCDTTTCSSVIWSAATPNLPGSTQLEAGMKRLGLPLTLPQPCPSS